MLGSAFFSGITDRMLAHMTLFGIQEVYYIVKI